MFCCVTHVILRGNAKPGWLAALGHALGQPRGEQLMLLLAFTRMAHYWTQLHAPMPTG